jgi:hypothetical protein
MAGIRCQSDEMGYCRSMGFFPMRNIDRLIAEIETALRTKSSLYELRPGARAPIEAPETEVLRAWDCVDDDRRKEILRSINGVQRALQARALYRESPPPQAWRRPNQYRTAFCCGSERSFTMSIPVTSGPLTISEVRSERVHLAGELGAVVWSRNPAWMRFQWVGFRLGFFASLARTISAIR